MKWPALALTIALTPGLTACDRLPFFGGGGGDTTAADTAAAPAQAQPAAPQPAATPAQTQPAQQRTAQPRTTPPTRRQATTPPTQPARTTAAQPVRTDEPWTPRFTGTVNPGMTAEEVIAQWGPPVAERSTGGWTYLYFRNGCEATCGTFDVVFLQDGQVVDAIVRAPGHIYSGVSSSPRGRPAEFTAPGMFEQPNGAT